MSSTLAHRAPVRRVAVTLCALLAAAGLAACGSDSAADDATASGDDTSTETAAPTTVLGDPDAFPVVIEHAFGSTTIEELPERVVSVDWANHEAALALGVVPVAMQKVTWGDDNGDGVLPWVEERLAELGAATPTLLDETDGYDYEAISNADPDVILAAYSGMTEEQYERLSEIAPVVAYPEIAWGTTWQEMTTTVGTALGLEPEATELVASLEQHVADEAATHPEIARQNAMFSAYDATDLSQIGFYSTLDPRPVFLDELGLTTAPVVVADSAGTDAFWLTRSSEDIEAFEDVELIVLYGDDSVIATLQADPLLSRIPAVSNGAVVVLPIADSPLAVAANPTPLSITSSYGDSYIALVAEAAAKAS